MHPHLRQVLRCSSTLSRDKLMRLRRDSNMALSACLGALEEAGGDLDAAREILCRQGGPVVGDRTPPGAEGAIHLAQVDPDTMVVARLRSASDFVARSSVFAELSARVVDDYLRSGEGSAETRRLVEQYSRILKEPIAVDVLTTIRKEAQNTFGTYMHGRLPNGMASVVAIVEVTGRQAWQPDLKTFADKLACHVTGMNPASLEALGAQDYLFAQGEATPVKNVLASLKTELVHFTRVSIK